MIKIYTKSEIIAKRLEEIEVDYLFLKEDDTISNALLLCNPDELTELCMTYSNVKILVLTASPNFVEGMTLLQKGVRGYGNLYMQQIHLLQALKAIENSAIWLYPDMMQELIAVGSDAATHNVDVFSSLSAREQDVAKEIEKGESNKEIAIALGITERTVKAHLSSIYEKLEVGDRLALAMLLRH